MVGNNFYLIALPWYVLQLTGSKYDLTLTGVVQTLPGLAGLFIGVLVDRWNKRRTMIVADFLRGIVALALFSITIFHVVNSRNFMIILFLIPLAELIGTVFYPAQMSLMPKIVPNSQMDKAMAWNQSGSSVAGIAGLFGGGTILSLLGAPFMFAFNGLSYIVSSVSLFFVRVSESKKLSMQRSGLFVAILNATTNTVALRVTPADVQGRVFGALGAASTLSQPLGMLIFGWLMINLNLTIVFSVMGIIVIGGSLLYLRGTLRNAGVPIMGASE